MIKSPLRYPGGKSRAVELLSSLLPSFKEYREPFLGGGSLFVYLKQRYCDRIFWGNDLLNELYLFWVVPQSNPLELTNKINEWRKQFLIEKELYQFLNIHFSTFNELEKAAAFFIYNRITFSGTSLSGGYSEASFTGRFTESSIKRLLPFSRVIQDTTITNIDYETLATQKGSDVFIFLDPPYYSARKSALYGRNGNLHKEFDHERFASAMKHCNHKWLITYDDSEYIQKLFSFATIIPWSLTYGMRNITAQSNQLGKELFISNYLEPRNIHQKENQLELFEH